VREQEALYEQITGKIAVQALRPSYLVFNEGFAAHPWTDSCKRAVDVVLSSIGVLLSWPLMLATAVVSPRSTARGRSCSGRSASGATAAVHAAQVPQHARGRREP
jgi:hypothetical protein